MILVRSPLHIPLIGAGSDFPGFYRLEAGAVVTMAINRFVSVLVSQSHNGPRMDCSIPENDLVSAISEYLDVYATRSMRVSIISDSCEWATTLGDAPATTVALLLALSRMYRGIHPKSLWLAETANLLAEKMEWACGRHDAFAAAYGGINMFRFFPDESVEISPSAIPQRVEQRLSSRLLFFKLPYAKYVKKVVSSDVPFPETKFRREMADLAESFFSDIEEEDYDNLGTYFDRSWTLRSEILPISEIAEENYRTAKLAGAKGGCLFGNDKYMLIYAEKDKHVSVRTALNLHVEDFKIHLGGTEILWEDK